MDKSSDRNQQPQPAAELHGVGVCVGGRWILQDVNLAVPAGVCCAVVGPNGCGKSTLARVLEGFVWPTAGQVSVLGRRFGETDLHALRKHVKLVQPNAPVDFAPAMPCTDVVLSGAFGTVGLFEPPPPGAGGRAAELMRRLGVERLGGSAYGTLSTGERMRALIARALMVPPALLLLDEPTAGLDLVGREMLLAGLDAIMASHPRPTVLLVSHHLEELPRSTDWAVLMRAGRVTAAGPAADVLADGPMTEAFGVPVRVRRDDGRLSAAVTTPGRPWVG